MLSRFFIDRPIFATVLSVLITLVGFIALLNLPLAQYPRITPPGVQVSISYPGASAQVVADTVAAPIEQYVTGVPGMLYMSSQSGNDGSYTLSTTFDVSADLNTALVMVQNRVTLAMPLLPTPVQNQGITIRKKTPDILMVVNFISEGDRYNDIYLSNFVLINVKDEVLRVEGVSDVNIFGERDYSIRAWLDPQKIAARNMTAGDVASAVRQQNIEAALGQIGQPPAGRTQAFQLPIDTLGRLSEPEQFADIIVKVGGLPQPPVAGAAGSSSGGSGAPGGIGDPLQLAMQQTAPASAPTTSNGKTTSSTPSTDTTGATSTGVSTSGGGSTGGGATGAAAGAPTGDDTGDQTTDSAASGSNGGSSMDQGAASSPASSPGPQPPAASIVRLRDITTRVEMGALNYNTSCIFDGRPSVGLAIFQMPGTNALDVAKAVRQKMEELKARFPAGVSYTIGYDTTPYISESIGEVVGTLIDAIILVAIVVLVFLQDWRAMILPLIDVPVSLIGTFAVMAAMGYSLNNISLFGLVLAIGIVVDDAIVVLENIERQMAKGYDTRTATIKAMQEISGPILAITLVLCAVFVPCAFVSGITGRFFRQFAVTIAASTVISAINALTMTPSRALLIFKTKEAAGGGRQQHKREALPWWIFGLFGGLLSVQVANRFLADALGWPHTSGVEDQSAAESWLWWAIYFAPGLPTGLVFGWFLIGPINAVLGAFFGAFNRFFDGITSAYGWTIGKALHLSVGVLLIYGGLLALTYWVFQVAPTGFVPQQDMGRLIISVQLPDSASLQRSQAALAEVEQITRNTPGVRHTIGIAGISFIQQANGSNFASLFVILQPFAERQTPELKDEAIMKSLRQQWAAKVKDAMVFVSGASPIPGLSVAGGFKVIVQDRGGLGVGALQEQTDRLVRKLQDPRNQLGLVNVSTSFRSNTPQLYMDIDRTKAAALGVSLDDVNQTLQVYLGSLYVNSFNVFGRHWQVTLQADGQFRTRPEDVNLLQVRNQNGQMVPLGTLVTLREISGPIFVQRYNLYTAAPITGGLLPGVSSGPVIEGVNELSDETLPRSMKTEWTELMFMQIKEGNTTLVVFALAILCVFLALSALYESWTLPLAVILVVPLCMLCSIAGVLLANTSVNIFVQIGLVVLVGLACKNAILVVEFAKELHQGGRPVFEATLEASRLRLRPILMTSFAFILGVAPLVVAHGAGAEMRRSLGTAMFSGMLGVTLFGILLTPVFFYVIQGVGETRLFASAASQWIVSCTVGTLVGLMIGFLLAQLGLVSLWGGMLVGGCTGLQAVLLVRGVHRRIMTP